MATSSFNKAFKVNQEAFDKLNREIGEVKNPINVIDQELIDIIDEFVGIECDPPIYRVKQLLTMVKDLIEINAEITKQNQKLLNNK